MNLTKYCINDFLETRASGVASFSPNAKDICYLNNDTGTSQIYLLNIENKNSTQLTEYADSISRAVFSPIDNVIIFQMSLGGNEQSQLFFLNPDTKEVTPITNNEVFRYDFGSWSPDGTYISFRSNERNGTDFDVYVLNIRTMERRCIFSEGGSVSAGTFSPMNTYLTFSKNTSNVHSDLYVCKLSSGENTCISLHGGEESYGTPQWLSDESGFFVTTDQGREFTGLARYDFSTKSFAFVFTTEWDIDAVTLNTEGTHMAITINEDGYHKTRLYETSSFTEVVSELPTSGLMQGVRFSNDGQKLLFTFTDSVRTQDVWLYDIQAHSSRQLTHSEQGVPSEIMVQPELIRFKSFDDLTISAFIYRPKDIEEGKKLPVIIDIHGGPDSQYQPAFARLTQYFVYNGYVVVAPNVRGSSGYGKTFLTLDNIEKRMDSVKDLVALHEYLVSFPDVDQEKIVLSGASYGGFMVLAGLAFYPDLWAAGIDIVGIANFVTFLENTAPYRRALRESEYGSLEHDRELLEKISPINSVKNIKAPLMVIHGANDPRVPLSEAEQIVARLKELGRKVELLVYEDEGHGLGKLKNRLDAYPKVVGFLEEIFGKTNSY